MASGKTYRQKGDLRALNTITETAYNVPDTASGSASYMGTLDTVTPKDSETLEEVYADGSRAVGTIYRTAADFGFSAKLKFAATHAWHAWITLALGTSSTSTAVGTSFPSSFTAWFKTAVNEAHAYTGSVVEKLVMTASE